MVPLQRQLGVTGGITASASGSKNANQTFSKMLIISLKSDRNITNLIVNKRGKTVLLNGIQHTFRASQSTMFSLLVTQSGNCERFKWPWSKFSGGDPAPNHGTYDSTEWDFYRPGTRSAKQNDRISCVISSDIRGHHLQLLAVSRNHQMLQHKVQWMCGIVRCGLAL